MTIWTHFFFCLTTVVVSAGSSTLFTFDELYDARKPPDKHEDNGGAAVKVREMKPRSECLPTIRGRKKGLIFFPSISKSRI